MKNLTPTFLLPLLLVASIGHATPVQTSNDCKIPKATETSRAYPSAFRVYRCVGSLNTDPHRVTQAVFKNLQQAPLKLHQTNGFLKALSLLRAEVKSKKLERNLTSLWPGLEYELYQTIARAKKLENIHDLTTWKKSLIPVVHVKWKNANQEIDIAGIRYDILSLRPICQMERPCPEFANWSSAVRVINLLAVLDAHSEQELFLDFIESRK